MVKRQRMFANFYVRLLNNSLSCNTRVLLGANATQGRQRGILSPVERLQERIWKARWRILAWLAKWC